jgi:N utilization substance protein B
VTASRISSSDRTPPPARETRHVAREGALQMLYQWEVGRADVNDVPRQYGLIEGPEVQRLTGTLETFRIELVRGTIAHLAAIDRLIAAGSEHWRLERMAIVDRLILRLAVYEFLETPETPRTVVINEALELARTFGDEETVRFVNGVLDGIRKRLES